VIYGLPERVEIDGTSYSKSTIERYVKYIEALCREESVKCPIEKGYVKVRKGDATVTVSAINVDVKSARELAEEIWRRLGTSSEKRSCQLAKMERLRDLKREIREIRKRAREEAEEKYRTRIEELRKRVESLRAANKSLKERVEHLRKEVEELRREKSELLKKLRKLESEVAKKDRTIDALRKSVEKGSGSGREDREIANVEKIVSFAKRLVSVATSRKELDRCLEQAESSRVTVPCAIAIAVIQAALEGFGEEPTPVDRIIDAGGEVIRIERSRLLDALLRALGVRRLRSGGRSTAKA